MAICEIEAVYPRFSHYLSHDLIIVLEGGTTVTLLEVEDLAGLLSVSSNVSRLCAGG